VLAIHPFGKIPAMRDGTFELFEAKAIATYADRAFPGPRLIPEDAKLAGKTEQWISAINTSVFPGVVGYMQAHAFPKGPGGKADAAAIAALMPSVRRHIHILDRAVDATGHLAGDDFDAGGYLPPAHPRLSDGISRERRHDGRLWRA
jgi:glutathione S-transferase